MSRVASRSEAGPARVRRRWARPLTALLSVAATLLVLELVVRWSGAPAGPARLREGLYVSQLPLVTGRETTQGQLGPALQTAKRPGEIRIFVFGESSVQGLPWGYGASPVAMLRDQLHALAPAQDLTVVNMGRSASTAMDAYYYLASIAPYAPDFVVFYQGSNDFFDGEAERCAPLLHPELHRAWRWLVERSRLFWAARALGPRFYGRRGGGGGQQTAPVFGADAQPGDRCDAAQAFTAWTDILVTTAQRLGARVIVTTPVENPLRWPDEITSSAPAASEPYRRLLACALTDGCDVVTTWKGVRDTPSFTWDRLRPRRRAWVETAATRGARLVDFADHVARDANEGLRPPLFVEEVHLSMEGYWRLSWLWTTEIGALLDGRGPASETAPPPPALDERFYVSEAPRYGSKSTAACSLLRTGALHLRENYRVLAAGALESAVRVAGLVPDDEASSRVATVALRLLAAERREAGLQADSPAIDVAEIARQLRNHDDCSTLPRP